MIFDLKQLIREYNTYIYGVVHVGGYDGKEASLYRDLGIVHGVFFEPQSGVYEVCKRNASGYIVEKLALGDHEGDIELNISYTEGGMSNGSGASSSILTPKLHLTEHPQVKFICKETVQITTLDTYLASKKKEARYNFLNIDVQGYELNVLKGAKEFLNHSPCKSGMIVEVNRAEVYEGCPLVEEIDEFVEYYGYRRKVTVWQSKSWGDAYYHKDFHAITKCTECGRKIGWIYAGDATHYIHLDTKLTEC